MTTGSSSLQSHKSLALSYSACSDIGRKREENQDSFCVFESETLSFYAVADGMGGVQGGAVASNIAVETFRNELQNKESITSKTLYEAVSRSNSAVFERGRSDASLAGMGTTLVALVFYRKLLYVVHVGDSRAYRFRAGEITRLTEDHTLVQELVKAGTITLDQARNHPVAHMLTRSLGPAVRIQADCSFRRDGPLKGDRYLLCSDGLYNLMSEKEIAEQLASQNIETAVPSLVALANERGGTDNITVLAVEVGDGYASTVEELEVEVSSSEEDKIEEAATGVSETDSGGNHTEYERQIPLESLKEALRQRRKQSGVRADEDARNSFEAARLGIRSEEAEAEAGLEQSRPERKPQTRLSMTVTWVAGVLFASVGGFLFALMVFAPRYQQAPSLPPATVAVPVSFNALPTLAPIAAAEVKQEFFPMRQAELLEKRRLSLTERVGEIERLLSAFESPSSEKVTSIIAEASQKQLELEGGIVRSRVSTDEAARKLSVWYDRRTRLESTDALSMAAEIAVSSEVVRIKKQAFENATWAYLNEAEKLKSNPDDKDISQRVGELVRARKEALNDLTQEVRKVVDIAIAEADKHIAELSVEREQLEARLRSVKEELELAQLIQGSDETARIVKIESLKAQAEASKAELAELEHAADLLAPVPSAAVAAAAPANQ